MVIYCRRQHTTYFSIHVKCPIVIKFLNPWQIFIKVLNIKSKAHIPSASRTDTCGKAEGRTDGRTTDRRMDTTQVIGNFRDYANASRHTNTAIRRTCEVEGSKWCLLENFAARKIAEIYVAMCLQDM
jgi:hypothetical protein